MELNRSNKIYSQAAKTALFSKNDKLNQASSPYLLGLHFLLPIDSLRVKGNFNRWVHHTSGFI